MSGNHQNSWENAFSLEAKETDFHVKSADDINSEYIKRFAAAAGLDTGDTAVMIALMKIPYAIKGGFVTPDKDGWFSVQDVYNYTAANPHTMDTFLQVGFKQIEPTLYGVAEVSGHKVFGIDAYPDFLYLDKEDRIAVVPNAGKTLKIKHITDPKSLDAAFARTSPRRKMMYETTFLSHGGRKEGPRIIFDMDGVLAKWSDDWNKTVSGNSTWRTPGFFSSLPPHLGMVNLANDLISRGFDVYVITSPSGLSHSVGEKTEWIQKYLPQLPYRKILFVEKSEDKVRSIMPDSSYVIFDDYIGAVRRFDETGANIVKVTNNLSDTREPAIAKYTCSAMEGMTVPEVVKIYETGKSESIGLSS